MSKFKYGDVIRITVDRTYYNNRYFVNNVGFFITQFNVNKEKDTCYIQFGDDFNLMVYKSDIKKILF